MLNTSKQAWSRFRSAGLMGGGTVLVGASGYAFVALAGHTLPTTQAAAVSSFYLLVNIIGPGLFVALEQETNRATSSTLESRGPLAPVIRRGLLHGAGLLLAVFLVLGAISPILVERVLLGHWGLFLAVLLSAITAAAVFLARGVLGGMRQFGGYSATLAGEGLMRLVPALAVAAVGMAAAGLYGFVYALGSGVGTLAGLEWIRRGRAATGATTGVTEQSDSVPDELDTAEETADLGTARGLTFLVGATLLAQVVANLAPMVVTARMVTDTATAAAFASAFILARVPLFVISPAQALVLPAVTAAATRGDHAAARRILRLMLLAVAGIGLAGTAAAATVGPWAVQVFFGAQVQLSAVVLGVLGFSTMLLMAAQILQATLVAFRAHRAATISWLVSTAVLVGLLMLSVDPIRAAVIAQLTASLVVVAGMLTALRPRLRDNSTAVLTTEVSQ